MAVDEGLGEWRVVPFGLGMVWSPVRELRSKIAARPKTAQAGAVGLSSLLVTHLGSQPGPSDASPSARTVCPLRLVDWDDAPGFGDCLPGTARTLNHDNGGRAHGC